MDENFLPGFHEQNSVPWLMRHIERTHRRAARVRMSYEAGKEPGQPILLMVLQQAKAKGASVSQNDLAQALRVSDPTITASLKSLERQGYITREPDPTDMRRKLPVLTPLGEEVADVCRKNIEQVNRAMLEGLTEEEHAQLVSLLQRLSGNLDSLLG